MKKVNESTVELLGHFGDDATVANAARVSFAKEVQMLSNKDIKLIQYLASHKHYSPFNHAFLSFRVKAPIFVARQLVKHKFMPWNEVSRRYVDEEPEFYFPSVWRLKAENVKQGSSDVAADVFPDSGIPAAFTALNTYNALIDSGVCPEQARMVLPQNMMTEWIWSGTLGAFCDMLKLRTEQSTQKETREVAEKIMYQITSLFPISVAALLDKPIN